MPLSSADARQPARTGENRRKPAGFPERHAPLLRGQTGNFNAKNGTRRRKSSHQTHVVIRIFAKIHRRGELLSVTPPCFIVAKPAISAHKAVHANNTAFAENTRFSTKKLPFYQPVKGERAVCLSLAGVPKTGENRGKPGKTGGIFGAL